MPKLSKGVLNKDEFEALDEKYRELFVEREGKYVLDVESIDDMPQVGGLKSALQKERDSNRALKKELQGTVEKFRDLDPEKAREALKKLHELEDKELMDAGKVEELVAKKTERMVADHQQQVSKFQEKITSKDSELTEANRRLANLQIEGAITRVLTSKTGATLGVVPQAIPDIVRRARDIFKLDEKTGLVTPYRVDGSVLYGKDPSTPMPMEEWLEGLKSDCPHYFGAHGGDGGFNKGGAPGNKKRSQMNTAEKAKFIEDHGQEAYLSLPA